MSRAPARPDAVRPPPSRPASRRCRARASAQSAGPGQMHDLAMTELDQVPDGEPGAGDLIDTHRPAGPGQVALDQHDRHSDGPAAGDLEGVVLTGDDDDAFDSLAAQVLHRVVEQLAGQRGQADGAREQPSLPGGGLDAALDAGRSEVACRRRRSRPTMPERPLTRARAAVFGRYASCSIARSTRSRVSGRIRGEPLITRETVWWETPARRATSCITGARAAAARAPTSAPPPWLRLHHVNGNTPSMSPEPF